MLTVNDKRKNDEKALTTYLLLHIIYQSERKIISAEMEISTISKNFF